MPPGEVCLRVRSDRRNKTHVIDRRMRPSTLARRGVPCKLALNNCRCAHAAGTKRERGKTMGLRLKFNLVLIVVFVIGLGVAGFMSHELLHKNAQDEVLRNAGVMMEAALSMRGYTNTQIRPLVPFNDATFYPQSVPAYSATEIMNALRKKYTDYSYKEA